MTKITKQVLIVLAVVIFTLSLGNNGCQRKRLVDYTKKINTIENTNTQLLKSIENKDLKLVISDAEITRLNSKNLELELKNDGLKVRGDALEAALDTFSDLVNDIPPDESYLFLQAVYPYKGILQYSFNEKQVKAIHVNYLEKLTLRDLNDNLQAQINNLSHQLKFSDAIQRKLLEQVEILKSEKEDYEKIVTNKSEENKILIKQVKKEKRKTVLYKLATGIAAGLAVLIAL